MNAAMGSSGELSGLGYQNVVQAASVARSFARYCPSDSGGERAPTFGVDHQIPPVLPSPGVSSHPRVVWSHQLLEMWGRFRSVEKNGDEFVSVRL